MATTYNYQVNGMRESVNYNLLSKQPLNGNQSSTTQKTNRLWEWIKENGLVVAGGLLIIAGGAICLAGGTLGLSLGLGVGGVVVGAIGINHASNCIKNEKKRREEEDAAQKKAAADAKVAADERISAHSKSVHYAKACDTILSALSAASYVLSGAFAVLLGLTAVKDFAAGDNIGGLLSCSLAYVAVAVGIVTLQIPRGREG